MNRKGLILVVIGLVLALMAPTAFAGDSVKIWGKSVIFRDGNGKESKLQGQATVTSGAIYNLPSGSGGDLVGSTNALSGSLLEDESVTTAKILNGPDGQIMISTDASSGSIGYANVTASGDVAGDLINTGAFELVIQAEAVETSMILNCPDGQVRVSTDADSGSVVCRTISLTGDVTGTLTNGGTAASTVVFINGNQLGNTTPGVGNILVGTGGASAFWQSVAPSGDVTVGGDGAFVVGFINGIPVGNISNASTNIIIGDGRALQNAILGGDVRMASDGAVTIQDNVVGSAELSLTEYTLQVPTGEVFTNASATQGSIVLGFRPVANIDSATMYANSVAMNSSSVQLFVNAVNNSAYMEWVVIVVGP